jgi:hypothetical protein
MRFARRICRFVAIGWRVGRGLPTLAPSRTDPPFRTRRSKMNKSYGRISENVLFAAVLAAAIGWTAVSLAADQPAASASASYTVAHDATGTRNS